MVAINKVEENIFEVIQSGILLFYLLYFYKNQLYPFCYKILYKVNNGFQIVCTLDKNLSINQGCQNT